MLGYITLLLACQLAGEAVVRLTGIPVPGPVAGMAILLAGLIWRGGIPTGLDQAGSAVLRYLTLMFVPAGVGVVANLDLLREQWLPILIAVIPGTLITIAVTATLMARLNRAHANAHD